MTAWQNQPPLSRRQARDSARLQQSETETEASTDTSEADVAAPPPIVKPGSGRRVQWDPSTDSAEPVSPRTQTRLPEDGSAASPDPAAECGADAVVESDSESVVGSDTPPTDPAFRVRDFRPERRSSFAPLAPGAAEPWAPPAMSGTPATDEKRVEEKRVEEKRVEEKRADGLKTDGSESAESKPDDAASAADVDESKAAEPKSAGWSRPLPSDLDAPERTMTRRELRMLRARALADGEPEPSVEFGPDGVNVTTSSITVVPQAERDDAAASVRDVEVPADGVAPESDVEPVADDAGVVTEEPIIPALIEPAGAHNPANVNAGTVDAGTADAEVVEPGAVDSTVADIEIVDAEIVDAEIVEAEIVEEESPSDAESPEVITPSQGAGLNPTTDMRRPMVPASEADFGGSTSGPESEPAAPVISGSVIPAAIPFGHWSTQGDNAENAVPGDPVLSRNVGVSTGAITTHALVLPSSPESGDKLLAPLNQTGEIMVTGSIDLPRSFGSTGAHPALFDHPDVDALIDEADRDDATAESAPVRAVRAVASNSSARAVIEAPAPRRSRLPLILGIVGGAVLLAAIVVIVTVFVINGL